MVFFETLGFLSGTIGLLISLIGLVLAIWVIYDVLVNQPQMSAVQKLLWIIAAIFFSIITAIIYYLVVKR